MSRRSLALAPVLATLTMATPALAQSTPAPPTTTPPPESVTATGTSEVKVVPANRHSNASIVAAVHAAETSAVPAALAAAHAKAVLYAQDTGLTLGSVLSVTDAQNSGVFIGPVIGNTGPFGFNKYCGTERRATVRKVDGKEKVVRTKKVHACVVPAYASSTLTVTYAAT